MSIPTPTLSPSEISYIITSLSHPSEPTRSDSRAPLSSRPISISYGVFPHANGSAKVTVGGTEVVAGIRLEVVDVPKDMKKGEEGWRAKVEVDVTPQAFPSAAPSSLSTISTYLSSLITAHFIPSIPSLPIIAGTKYFQPHLHLTLLSSSGNIPSALILASRAAFSDLRIPKTKVISWNGEDTEEGVAGAGAGDLSGIKAAIQGGKGRGKGKSRYVARGGEDWDLDNSGDGEGVEFMPGREKLPVLVTLNLVPNSPNIFIDATSQEESACPTRLHLFFGSPSSHTSMTSETSVPAPTLARIDQDVSADGDAGENGLKVCGIRFEGPSGLDSGSVRGLLEEGKRIAFQLMEEVNTTLPN